MDTTDIEARSRHLTQLRLSIGAHASLDDGACPMELVSWLAGEDWSDRPESVCPVVATFVRSWNDALPQADRTAVLLPLVSSLAETRASKAVEHRRALMAADWLVRTNSPVWFRLAGLTRQAETLAGLPEIRSLAEIPALTTPIRSSASDAQTAREAAWKAEWTIPRDAPRDAAWFDAWEAAWVGPYVACQLAAWDPLWAAARDGARNAAAVAIWSPAHRDIRSPIPQLRQSTLALIERMIKTMD